MPAPVASGWSILPGGPFTHWKAPPWHGARTFLPFPKRSLNVRILQEQTFARSPGVFLQTSKAGRLLADRFGTAAKEKLSFARIAGERGGSTILCRSPPTSLLPKAVAAHVAKGLPFA